MQVAIAARRASCGLFAPVDQDALSLFIVVCWNFFHNLLSFHDSLLSHSPTIRSAYKPLIDLLLSSTFLTLARPFDLPGTPLTQPSKLPLSNFHHPCGQQQPHLHYFDYPIVATHHGSRNYLRY
jgi:hypothetical protein